MDPDFVVQVKCIIFWLNWGLRVFLDTYVPDFPKSTSKISTCFVQKQLESLVLGASQQCIPFGCNVCLKNYSELLNHSYFSKLIWSMYC